MSRCSRRISASSSWGRYSLLRKHRDGSFFAVVPLFGSAAFLFVLGRWLSHTDAALGVRDAGLKLVLFVGFLAIGPVGLASGRLAGGLPFTRRLKAVLSLLAVVALVGAIYTPIRFTGTVTSDFGLEVPGWLAAIVPASFVTIFFVVRWARHSELPSLRKTVVYSVIVLGITLINDTLSLLAVVPTIELLDVGLTATVLMAAGFNERLDIARREVEALKSLIDERKDAAAKLAAMSRHAGMAEVASNVLHNVGNGLNSVNISTTLIAESFTTSRLADINRVVEVMSADGDMAQFVRNDPRGAQSLELLRQLLGELTTDQERVADEARTLLDRVEHIKRVVARQQEIAVGSSVREDVDLSEALKTALDQFADMIDARNIACDFDLPDDSAVPRVATDRHHVLQILLNLIANAIDAVAGSPAPRLGLHVSLQEDAVVVAVSDNGCGMSPEVAGRVFEHGFTTKPHGHGFGLHSSAVTAELLGAEMRAVSPGEGMGATFSLAVPLDAAQPSRKSEKAEVEPLEAGIVVARRRAVPD